MGKSEGSSLIISWKWTKTVANAVCSSPTSYDNYTFNEYKLHNSLKIIGEEIWPSASSIQHEDLFECCGEIKNEISLNLIIIYSTNKLALTAAAYDDGEISLPTSASLSSCLLLINEKLWLIRKFIFLDTFNGHFSLIKILGGKFVSVNFYFCWLIENFDFIN